MNVPWPRALAPTSRSCSAMARFSPAVGYFAQRQRYADAQAAGELLAPAKDSGQMDQVIANSTLNGVLQAVFALLTLVVVANAVVVVTRAVRAHGLPTTEEPPEPSRIVEPSGLFATTEEKRAMAEQERLVGVGARGHGTFTEEGPSR